MLDYSYDRQNNLTSVTDSINGVEAGLETFEYDLLDRVTRITQSGNGVAEKAVAFAYDAASQLTQLDSFSDLAQTQLVASSLYSYDLAGRLEQIEQSNDGGAIAKYRYQYDAANRITQLVSPDGVSNFTYDARDQLTSAEQGFQTDEAYSYDANGNRTNVGYLTGPNNQLLEDEQYRYDYDGEGNRIRQTEKVTGEVTEYDWDHRNQLIAVVTRDAAGNITLSAEYDYDVFGRRILKTVDSDGDGILAAETERFVYDGEHIALVFDGNGNLAYRYLHGPAIDQVLAQEDAEGSVLFALTDHLGSVRDLVDTQGNVANHISYDSFGNITGQTNSNIEFRFAYTGREFDVETGLYYYRARYYDPSLGQFISQDPLSFGAGDANLNRYVGNSPLNFTDPSGNVFAPALAPPVLTVIAKAALTAAAATAAVATAPVSVPVIAGSIVGAAVVGGVVGLALEQQARQASSQTTFNLAASAVIDLTQSVGDSNTLSQAPPIPLDITDLKGIPLENLLPQVFGGEDSIKDAINVLLPPIDLSVGKELIQNILSSDFDEFLHPNPEQLLSRPGQIARALDLDIDEVNTRIHRAKRDPSVRANQGRRNPDIGVDPETGDIFIEIVELGKGIFSGDAIGNIFD